MSAVSIFDWQIYRHLFSTPRMEEIFGERNTLGQMIEAEKAAARAQGKLGIVPPAAAAAIDNSLNFEELNLDRLRQDTLDVGRPIAGLVTQLAAQVPEPHKAWVHYGVTTYDIMDTGKVLQVRDGLDEILAAMDRYSTLLQGLSKEHRDTVMIGRSNNHHALPTTFGVRLAVWIEELMRHRDRLEAAKERAMVVGFAGAVGTLASMGDDGIRFRQAVATELGLGHTLASWHNARDTVTEISLCLGNLCGSLARNAQNINAMGASEVREISERGDPGRGRSTSLPQKRNPRAAEFAESVARLGRQRAMGMVEFMGQEGDRCGGTWIGEWLLVPETFLLTSGALHWACDLMERLDVHPENMRANIDVTLGMAVGERFTLALAQQLGKFDARRLLDAACIRVYEEGITLADALAGDPEVCKVLSQAEIDRLVDPAGYVGSAPQIVDEVLAMAAKRDTRSQE